MTRDLATPAARLAFALGMAAALTAPASLEAAVTLTAGDASGSTSFNAAGNWSEPLAPHAGTNYEVSISQLRTPPDAGSYTFWGDSLAILSGGQLYYKGAGSSGIITVSNLVLDGGAIQHLSGAADLFQLAGNLSVVADSVIYAKQGPITVSAMISGSGTITNPGSDGAGRTLVFANTGNTFTGSLVNNGRFQLPDGANLNFVIGASNVNNRVSGTGASTTFDGRFVFDLSGSSTNLGSRWTIASASGQTFGSSFSVDGFTHAGSGAGPGIWEASANGVKYSFDTSSGLLQVVTNFTTTTNPILDSHIALLRDSVVATNACLMPSTATYGRAINGISFQKQILLTFDGYQYTAWYDTVGTTQLIWLARRAVTNTSVGVWEKFQTDSEFLNGDESAWDAHDVIALGICSQDGTLHVAWDHHNNTLRYRRSVIGLCTTNKAAWGSGMLNAEQNWLVASGQTELDVTYPQFIATPGGGLVLDRRMGVSGNGDQYFQFYNPSAGAWSAKVQFINRAGTYVGPDPYGTTRTCTERCAYLNGFDFGPDGTIHVTWTWRESASQYGNRDICYAYSPDMGTNWYNNGGTNIANTSLGQTITQSSPGITVEPLDMRQLLINQQAQCVDNDGRVHVLMLHRRQDPGYDPGVFSKQFSTKFTAYYHYFRDPTTGTWTQRRIPPDVYPVGSRPKIVYDANGNVYAAYLSYSAGTDVVPGYTNGKLVIASASKASGYTDWAVAQALSTDFNGEPLIDQARLLADNILSVYIQENSATTTVVGTPLHVFDYAVGVNAPGPLSFSSTLNFFGKDALVVVPASSLHTYQLQASTILAPADWTDVGAALSGPDGMLALPDPDGLVATQRFYRVIQGP